MPPMVMYLTRCLCKHENTPRNWFSIFLPFDRLKAVSMVERLHDARGGA
jgi:hypothetical protein